MSGRICTRTCMRAYPCKAISSTPLQGRTSLKIHGQMLETQNRRNITRQTPGTQAWSNHGSSWISMLNFKTKHSYPHQPGVLHGTSACQGMRLSGSRSKTPPFPGEFARASSCCQASCRLSTEKSRVPMCAKYIKYF